MGGGAGVRTTGGSTAAGLLIGACAAIDGGIATGVAPDTPPSRINTTDPWERLSPIFTLTSLTMPE